MIIAFRELRAIYIYIYSTRNASQSTNDDDDDINDHSQQQSIYPIPRWWIPRGLCCWAPLDRNRSACDAAMCTLYTHTYV